MTFFGIRGSGSVQNENSAGSTPVPSNPAEPSPVETRAADMLRHLVNRFFQWTNPPVSPSAAARTAGAPVSVVNPTSETSPTSQNVAIQKTSAAAWGSSQTSKAKDLSVKSLADNTLIHSIIGKLKKSNLEAEDRISASKEIMLNQGDQRLVDIYELVSSQVGSIKVWIRTKLEEKPEYREYLTLMEDLDHVFDDLVKINLAIIFAALATAVNRNRAQIPHYEHQSFLTRLVILVNQKIGSQLPSYQELSSKENEELRIIFKKFTNDIITLFLPGKFDEIFVPKTRLYGFPLDYIVKGKGIRCGQMIDTLVSKLTDVPPIIKTALTTGLQPLINAFIEDQLADFLLEQYQSIKQGLSFKAEWTRRIQERVGAYNVDTLMAVPTTLLTEVVKERVQFDSAIAAKLQEILCVRKISENEREQTLYNLSQESLTVGILTSIQEIIASCDPSLVSSSVFLKDHIMRQIALGVVVKAMDLVISDDTHIEGDRLIQKLFEGVAREFQNIPAETLITDVQVEAFTADFPIPPVLKCLCIPYLTSELNKVKKELITKKQKWTQQHSYEAVKAKILKYGAGPQIISISEILTDKMIKRLTAIDVASVFSKFGLEELIEGIFEQYLPGMKFDPQLMEWLSANLHALNPEHTDSPFVFKMIKEQVLIIFLEGITKTIETSFENKDHLFIAQVMQHAKTCFERAFPTFSVEQRQSLSDALNFKERIHILEAEKLKISAIKKEFKRMKEQLPVGIQEKLQNAFRAHSLTVKASKKVEDLKKTLKVLLDRLNVEKAAHQALFTEAKIKQFSDALLFYKNQRPVLDDLHLDLGCRSDLECLQILRIELLEEETNPKTQKVFNHAERLIELFELPKEQLQLVKNYIDGKHALSRATKELNSANAKVEEQRAVLIAVEPKLFTAECRHAWVKALELLEQIRAAENKVIDIDKRIEEIQLKLDKKLEPFQILSKELFAVLGVDPALLKNIEQLVNRFSKKSIDSLIPELLLEHLAPIFVSSLTIEANKTKLQALVGSSVFNHLAQVVAEESMACLPVAINPVEIADQLTRVLPGTSDLQKIFVPQLTALLSNEDPTIRDHRKMVTRYLEGALVKFFIRVVEKSDGDNLFDLMSSKLKEIATRSDIHKLSKDDIIQLTQEKVFKEILHAIPFEELVDIPKPLLPSVYQVLQEQLKMHVLPLMLPLIEKEMSRKALKDKAPFFEQICNSLSSDLISFVPSVVSSYRDIAKDIFKQLSDGNATPRQLDQFADQVMKIVDRSRYNELQPKALIKPITNKALIRAYREVAEDHQRKDSTLLLRQLEGMAAVSQLDNVIFNIEDIVAKIADAFPSLQNNAIAQQELVESLHKWTHTDRPSYQSFTRFAKNYIESILFKMFHHIANQHAKDGKDGSIAAIHKLLDILKDRLTAFYLETQEMQTRIARENIEASKTTIILKMQKELDQKILLMTKELTDQVLKEVLAITSPVAFEGLPAGLQKLAYDNTKHYIHQFLLGCCKQLNTLNNDQQEIEKTRQNLEAMIGSACVSTIAYDIGRLTVDATLDVLNEKPKVGEHSKGVINITEPLTTQLRSLHYVSGLELPRILLQFSEGEELKKILGDHLKALEGTDAQTDAQNALKAGKIKAAEIVGNALLKPFENGIKALIDVEKNHSGFDRELIVNLLKVVNCHLHTVNQAKALAQKEGRSEFTHADFVAASESLHPAIPVKDPDYKESIHMIEERLQFPLLEQQKKELAEALKNLSRRDMTADEPLRETLVIKSLKAILGGELTDTCENRLKQPDANGVLLRDVLRKETAALKDQRHKHFYKTAIKQLLKTLFPNGRNDLTFLPQELRNPVWKLLKNQLGPMIIPLMMELLLDQDTISLMVSSSLETMIENLNEPIVISDDPNSSSTDQPNELDRASGQLILEVLNIAKLPEWILRLMKDEKGEIKPFIAMSLGRTLARQFNGDFVERMLKLGLNKLAMKDAAGKPMIGFDAKDAVTKEKERLLRRDSQEKLLDQLIPASIEAGASFYMRSKWAAMQHRLDTWIDKNLGKIGSALKHALDKVCRMIFFTIIGNVVAFILYPVTYVIKKAVYRYVNLKENQKLLMDMLRKAPKDQPLAPYAAYNESLVFNAIHALEQSIRVTKPSTVPAG